MKPVALALTLAALFALAFGGSASNGAPGLSSSADSAIGPFDGTGTPPTPAPSLSIE